MGALLEDRHADFGCEVIPFTSDLTLRIDGVPIINRVAHIPLPGEIPEIGDVHKIRSVRPIRNRLGEIARRTVAISNPTLIGVKLEGACFCWDLPVEGGRIFGGDSQLMLIAGHERRIFAARPISSEPAIGHVERNNALAPGRALQA